TDDPDASNKSRQFLIFQENGRHFTIPLNPLQSLKSFHTPLMEIVRHYWSCFPADESRFTKATKILLYKKYSLIFSKSKKKESVPKKPEKVLLVQFIDFFYLFHLFTLFKQKNRESERALQIINNKIFYRMSSFTSFVNFVLLSIPLLGPAFVVRNANPSIRDSFLHVVYVSIAAFFLTVWAIPILAKYTIKKLYGKDINKKGTPEGEVPIPESLGIACGIVYLSCGVVGQFWFTDNPIKVNFFFISHFFVLFVCVKKLVEYNAALLSICFMILLGFVDDVLDIPWRYKLVIPALATLPLLIAYNGETTVHIPQNVSDWLTIPRIVSLGYLYHFYMFLLIIFCTNAINIHAGINGLEAGQSFIIGIAILIHNIIESGIDEIGRGQHKLSMFIVAPFVATTAGLLVHNWYPSRVFVGDTYTMFSGMTLAVAGVTGHFSKTLLIFFIPQILNFLYSVPQLFGLCGYTCPRHRLPFYNTKTKLLEGIPSNLNLVNAFLCLLGPMSERTLCIVLLIFQTLCCCLGLFVRYRLAYLLY
ncbi:hypothetical protein RFI_06714, partial [Reticulomyxa filosa]